MPPDSSATRRRLLDAALLEFAEHGLAGARVDRIAEQAKANKRLIYAYYGNKEELFDTVMVHTLGVLADAVPFAATDLAGYAGALFDHMRAHPALVRLTLWKMLERPAVSELETEVYRPKVEQLAAAQRAGTVTRAIPPADLLMLVLGLVASWFTASPSLHALAEAPLDADAGDAIGRGAGHRAALVHAVQMIARAQ
jgi:AcrR family transcriptional regulator